MKRNVNLHKRGFFCRWRKHPQEEKKYPKKHWTGHKGKPKSNVLFVSSSQTPKQWLQNASRGKACYLPTSMAGDNSQPIYSRHHCKVLLPGIQVSSSREISFNGISQESLKARGSPTVTGGDGRSEDHYSSPKKNFHARFCEEKT